MNDVRVIVQDGMFDAYGAGYDHQKGLGGNRDVCERGGLASVLRWMLDEIERLELCQHDYENVRRMILAPEIEVPADMKDIIGWFTVYLGSHPEFDNIRRNAMLAFRRGQESKHLEVKP